MGSALDAPQPAGYGIGVRPTVLLFDIDGTLVTTGGAGRRAMALAFEAVCGDAHALDGIKLGGMTDRLILREGLTRIGRAFDEPTFERLIEVYLGHLTREVAVSPGYVVFPGVQAILDRCAATDAAMGLGTGNVSKGAYTKLERADLGRYFQFGGFGCDAEDRSELIRIAATRGAEALGEELANCRTVVIGDTPRDVQAAHANGAVCLAVSTGSFDAETLRAAGADWTVESLEDPVVQRALFEG